MADERRIPGRSRPQRSPSRPTRHAALLVVGAATLALGLGGCGEDASQAEAGPSTTVSGSPATTKPPGSPDRTVAGATLDIAVTGENVSPRAQTLSISAGETLTLRITSDRAGELHVHSSPEQTVAFGKGTSDRQVRLDKPGQVDIEEHDSGVLIARLLVR